MCGLILSWLHCIPILSFIWKKIIILSVIQDFFSFLKLFFHVFLSYYIVITDQSVVFLWLYIPVYFAYCCLYLTTATAEYMKKKDFFLFFLLKFFCIALNSHHILTDLEQFFSTQQSKKARNTNLVQLLCTRLCIGPLR